MPEKKKWYESWTLWLNGVAAVGLAVMATMADAGLDETAVWVAPVLAVLNFALRFKTNSAVTG